MLRLVALPRAASTIWTRVLVRSQRGADRLRWTRPAAIDRGELVGGGFCWVFAIRGVLARRGGLSEGEA